MNDVANIKGTVTLSLVTFDQLRDQVKEAQKIKKRTSAAFEHLEVFLSTIAKVEEVDKAIRQFNDRSHKATIRREDGRFKIEVLE